MFILITEIVPMCSATIRNLSSPVHLKYEPPTVPVNTVVESVNASPDQRIVIEIIILQLTNSIQIVLGTNIWSSIHDHLPTVSTL